MKSASQLGAAARRILVAAAGFVLVAALLGAVWTRVDRDSYVAANEALFAELPAFPGSTVTSVTSTGYRDQESRPIVGYGTRYVLALPAGTPPGQLAAFFERELRPEWQLVETLTESGGTVVVLNFRHGRAFLSVNLENWRIDVLEIGVDHAGA